MKKNKIFKIMLLSLFMIIFNLNLVKAADGIPLKDASGIYGDKFETVSDGVLTDSTYSFSFQLTDKTDIEFWGYDGKILRYQSGANRLKHMIRPTDDSLSGNIGCYLYNVGVYNGQTINVKCTFDWENIVVNGQKIYPVIIPDFNYEIGAIGFGFVTTGYGVKYELLDKDMNPININMSLSIGDIDANQYFAFKALSGSINKVQTRNDSIVYYKNQDDMDWFFASNQYSNNGLDSVARLELNNTNSFYIWYGSEGDAYSKPNFVGYRPAANPSGMISNNNNSATAFQNNNPSAIGGGWGFFNGQAFGPYEISVPTKSVTDDNENNVQNNTISKDEVFYYDIYEYVPLESASYYYSSFALTDILPDNIKYISSKVYDHAGNDVTNNFTITNNENVLTAVANNTNDSGFYSNTYHWQITVEFDDEVLKSDSTTGSGWNYDSENHSYVMENTAKATIVRGGQTTNANSSTVTTTYYKEPAQVKVNYIDIKNNENIITPQILNGYEYDDYTTEQKTFDGYRFVEVEGNTSGQMSSDNVQEVTYKYIKQSKVIVKHVDEITGEVLQQEIPATYDEGEEYTTSKKEIVGYTQTSDSKNTAGTVEREDIEVTYYYKKNTSVTVKYVDMVTGDTLDSTKIDGLENDEYTTEKKDIEGYEYIETQGKANGKMEREPLNVVYYYKKVSNLITEHIDANTGDKIIEDVITGYKEGDRYEALPQNLEGYIVVESPKETTGTMGREDVVKTFYYKKISAGLTVKYVDDITGELLDSKEYTGNEKDVITLEEKSFKYYVVTGRPDFSEVELTVEPQEVVYYYTRVSKVEIEGIDQDTGEVIYETEVTGLEGDKYETYPRQLEGYELVVVPENQNGEYKRDNEKVVYEYRKVAGKLTVKYVDDETGEILESYEIEGLRGDSYKTEKKEFEGYKLVRVEGEEIGELTEEGKEVIYHYEKKTGKIIVRYVDEEGNELLKEEMTGKVGEEYKVEEKEIEGYEVVERPEKLEGEYKEGETELVFVLRREKGTIKVEFVDEDGNVIQEAYVEENYVGEEFYIELPEIEGYKIVGDSKVKATFVEGELVIEAKYEKIQEEVNIDTGDIAVIAIVCVAVVCVAGIVYVVIRNKKKNSK